MVGGTTNPNLLTTRRPIGSTSSYFTRLYELLALPRPPATFGLV